MSRQTPKVFDASVRMLRAAAGCFEGTETRVDVDDFPPGWVGAKPYRMATMRVDRVAAAEAPDVVRALAVVALACGGYMSVSTATNADGTAFVCVSVSRDLPDSAEAHP